MDEYFEAQVIERLGALGERPVPPAVQSAHLASMARCGLSGPRRFPKVRIAVLGVAAVLLMSTGLAVAQVNAGPLSAAGERIAGVLGVDITDGKVTHGTDRYYGPDCLAIADGKGAINHGQYIKWVRQHQPDQLDAAKASNCGKPLDADEESDGD
jgi:hypothetical protein